MSVLPVGGRLPWVVLPVPSAALVVACNQPRTLAY